ncbi:MAG: ArsR family transcriptional regulator [Deltaproteobacteria bacterium]|nr:MAG: ArsR family transcriptional regulator [Deltaproteobacteria bacterium]
MTSAREFKNEVYSTFAEVTKALANPLRLEILDLLLQSPRSVDAIASAIGQSTANTSQHLQVLKRSRVVETRRFGTTIEYALVAGVSEVFVALRRLAEARHPLLDQAKRDYFGEASISRPALRAALASKTAVLLDVRPRLEFEHAHLPGALSIPIRELASRLDELPDDRLIVATCRGPYCTYADEAVHLIRASGREAVRFEDGVGEWVADGGAIA